MSEIMTVILVWGVGALACASAMRIWFTSDFAPFLTKLIRSCCWWLKRREGLWPDDIQLRYWVRSQWVGWAETHLWGWLGHLLNCPICFSCHLSYLAGMAVGFATGSWLIGLAATVSYPFTTQALYSTLGLIESKRETLAAERKLIAIRLKSSTAPSPRTVEKAS